MAGLVTNDSLSVLRRLADWAPVAPGERRRRLQPGGRSRPAPRRARARHRHHPAAQRPPLRVGVVSGCAPARPAAAAARCPAGGVAPGARPTGPARPRGRHGRAGRSPHRRSLGSGRPCGDHGASVVAGRALTATGASAVAAARSGHPGLSRPGGGSVGVDRDLPSTAAHGAAGRSSAGLLRAGASRGAVRASGGGRAPAGGGRAGVARRGGARRRRGVRRGHERLRPGEHLGVGFGGRRRRAGGRGRFGGSTAEASRPCLDVRAGADYLAGPAPRPPRARRRGHRRPHQGRAGRR